MAKTIRRAVTRERPTAQAREVETRKTRHATAQKLRCAACRTKEAK